MSRELGSHNLWLITVIKKFLESFMQDYIEECKNRKPECFAVFDEANEAIISAFTL